MTTIGRVVRFVLAENEVRTGTIVSVGGTAEQPLYGINVQLDSSSDWPYLPHCSFKYDLRREAEGVRQSIEKGHPFVMLACIMYYGNIAYSEGGEVNTWHWPERS